MLGHIKQSLVESFGNYLQRDLIPELIALAVIFISGLILAWILKFIINRIKRGLLTDISGGRNSYELRALITEERQINQITSALRPRILAMFTDRQFEMT